MFFTTLEVMVEAAKEIEFQNPKSCMSSHFRRKVDLEWPGRKSTFQATELELLSEAEDEQKLYAGVFVKRTVLIVRFSTISC